MRVPLGIKIAKIIIDACYRAAMRWPWLWRFEVYPRRAIMMKYGRVI